MLHSKNKNPLFEIKVHSTKLNINIEALRTEAEVLNIQIFKSYQASKLH